MPRYPINGVVGTPFGVFRKTDGRWHWGVDIAAPVGTVVVAPEAMRVVRVWANDSTPPFVGYGPGGVLARGSSGRYHLIAHLSPTPLLAVDEAVDEGDAVGEVSSLAHVHWELRREPIDSPSTRGSNTFDPVAWVSTGAFVEKSRGTGLLFVLALLWLISRS